MSVSGVSYLSAHSSKEKRNTLFVSNSDEILHVDTRFQFVGYVKVWTASFCLSEPKEVFMFFEDITCHVLMLNSLLSAFYLLQRRNSSCLITSIQSKELTWMKDLLYQVYRHRVLIYQVLINFQRTEQNLLSICEIIFSHHCIHSWCIFGYWLVPFHQEEQEKCFWHFIYSKSVNRDILILTWMKR